MQTLTDVNDYLRRDSMALADTVLECPYCGRKHTVPFESVHIGANLVGRLPQVAEKVLGHPAQSAWLLYDRAIEEIIHACIIGPLKLTGLPLHALGLGEPDFLLDSEENLMNAAATAIDPQADILIGAGSGVISDLTKGIATRLGKPFILFGTAPSMNSYTSITATITVNDIKLSKWFNPANGVMLDVNILSQAPKAMIHAGVGDLVARAVCNADWKLASLLKKLYFCPLPYQMTAGNELRYLEAAEGIGKSEPGAIHRLSEAILMSGYSMTVLDGETSPSSGGEHILSHFWDFIYHLRGVPKNLHGSQVGVGTLIMLAMYEYIRKLDPAVLDPQKMLRRRPSLEAIEADNQAHFGDKAVSFNEVARSKFLPDAAYLEFVGSVQANWAKIWEEVNPYLAAFDYIRQPMVKAGCPVTLEAIHRTLAEGVEALLYGSRYRTRYTLLDLAWELGIFPAAAEEILHLAQVV
jgi:glycerol-1-phosphate dehydrogenase [NAD(P)+]